MNKDTRFFLAQFLHEEFKDWDTYKSHRTQIENNGFLAVKSVDGYMVKIFNAVLAVLLTTKDLQARNMDTDTELTINGPDYLDTYIEAFRRGEEYFTKEFQVSPTVLYGDNAERYVRDLHANYYHTRHEGLKFIGWEGAKRAYPFILTHKEVERLGYYSGIANKVEEQVKKHPQLFAGFDKCIQDEDEPTTEGKKPDIGEEEENDYSLSTIEDWLYPFKENLSDPDYERLKAAYFQYCHEGTFPELKAPIQFRGNVAKKRLGWAIHEILKAHNERITPEVLTFSHKYLSVFSKDSFNKDTYQKSNLYKYHTEKTK